MSFRAVFLAVTIAFALVIATFLINRARPRVETAQPTPELVRATGKCEECHARTQYSVVHEYEMSMHAAKGVSPPPVRGKKITTACDLDQADGRELPELS
jgi:hydroxylamine dehydrogenase